MLHPGGYGGTTVADAVLVPGWNKALIMAFNGDNAGPQTVWEVIQIFQQVREEFAGASVFGSTWDQFTEQLLELKDSLPVVTAEVGDTWIYGAPSDPVKNQQFR
jgi:hypothetical protein